MKTIGCSGILVALSFVVALSVGATQGVASEPTIRAAAGELDGIVKNLQDFAARLESLADSQERTPILESVADLTVRLDGMERSCETTRRQIMRLVSDRRRKLKPRTGSSLWTTPPWKRRNERRDDSRCESSRRRHARAFATLVIQRLGDRKSPPRADTRELDEIERQMTWVTDRAKTFFAQLRVSLSKTAAAARDSQTPYTQSLDSIDRSPRELVKVMARVQKSLLKVMENQVNVLESVTSTDTSNVVLSGTRDVTAVTALRETKTNESETAD
jgi:hypothetical protein